MKVQQSTTVVASFIEKLDYIDRGEDKGTGCTEARQRHHGISALACRVQSIPGGNPKHSAPFAHEGKQNCKARALSLLLSLP